MQKMGVVVERFGTHEEVQIAQHVAGNKKGENNARDGHDVFFAYGRNENRKHNLTSWDGVFTRQGTLKLRSGP